MAAPYEIGRTCARYAIILIVPNIIFLMTFRSSSDFPVSLRYSSILNALVQPVNVSAHLCILKREFSTLTDDSYLIFDRLTVLRTGLTLSDSPPTNTTNLSINEILFTGFTAHMSQILRVENDSALSFSRN